VSDLLLQKVLKLVARLRKETCNSRHRMHFYHPVSPLATHLLCALWILVCIHQYYIFMGNIIYTSILHVYYNIYLLLRRTRSALYGFLYVYIKIICLLERWYIYQYYMCITTSTSSCDALALRCVDHIYIYQYYKFIRKMIYISILHVYYNIYLLLQRTRSALYASYIKFHRARSELPPLSTHYI